MKYHIFTFVVASSLTTNEKREAALIFDGQQKLLPNYPLGKGSSHKGSSMVP
jgi:hypothetical protein